MRFEEQQHISKEFLLNHTGGGQRTENSVQGEIKDCASSVASYASIKRFSILGY